jgi:hypothetical protein
VQNGFAVREEMEKRKPGAYNLSLSVQLMKAFETLGGTMYPREAGRFDDYALPHVIRDRDRLIAGRILVNCSGIEAI